MGMNPEHLVGLATFTFPFALSFFACDFGERTAETAFLESSLLGTWEHPHARD